MMYKILNTMLWRNRTYEYLVILICVLFIWALFSQLICSKFCTTRIKLILQKNRNLMLTIYLFILYLGLQFLNFPLKISRIIDKTTSVIFGILLINLINNIILNYFKNKPITKKNSHVFFNLRLVSNFVRILLWLIGIIVIADNLGLKITPIIASLGVGAVAVALASQVLLKDLFSCFAIYFDHPFDIGDMISISDFYGTVEHIGIKTTRLRSVNGEEIIFSNSDLTESRVRNYRNMQKKRVTFNINIVHSTSIEKIKLIPDVISEIIKTTPNTLFERAYITNITDFGINFEISYYILSNDFNIYVINHHKINLSIIEYIKKSNIKFANQYRIL